MVRIVLDAGHGGRDPGAVGNGLQEKNITLDLVKRIQKGLSAYENVQLLLTRDTDVFVELGERCRKANVFSADFFLSVHINSNAKTTAKGFESYVYPNTSGTTKGYQKAIHAEIVAASHLKDLGVKEANFQVLRETHMPALLTESGFISNADDANLLKDEKFLQMVADAHVTGIAKALGLKAKQAQKSAFDAMIEQGIFPANTLPAQSVSFEILANILSKLIKGY